MFSRIGFIGTGVITDAIIRGLKQEPATASDIVVSNRSEHIARQLTRDFTTVKIAENNQEIVDSCDLVVLAIRPQIAEDVITPLRFAAGQNVLSVIAATDRPALLKWIGADVKLVQATPLPFVEHRRGVTAVYPPDEQIAALFSHLGTAVECDSKREYDTLAALSALMASYFGIMDDASKWAAQHGMTESKARSYLAPLFFELGQVAFSNREKNLDELSQAYATKGGLNEQLRTDFKQNGGTVAIQDALTRVLNRIEA